MSATKQLIMDTTLELFSADGYEAASMEQITDTQTIPKAALV